MNRYLLTCLLALAAAATGPAFADDPTIDPHVFVSSLSRAQVRQQLQEYQASGINPWAQGYDPLVGFTSTRTRAEVRADYLAARDEVSALNGEDSGSAYLTAHMRHAAQPVLAAQ